MSLKHLGAGSQMPPLVKGKLRIYSMVFCPYAQRVRLVLAAKNIPYETVNVRLDKLPDWYLNINPSEQVPCLQHDDGRTLPESLIISEYIDNIYPENKLIPSDPFTNANHKLLIENFNKVIDCFYKLAGNGDSEAEKNLLEALDVIEKKLQKDFFGGDKPMFIDYMIWPWIERLEYLIFAKLLNLDSKRFPKLRAYIDRMKHQPGVKQTIISAEIFDKFYKAYLADKEPDYDIGLKF